ncbi:hypothetical protein [Bacteroides sp.]|uniref:hypothetical protein n=1 Tax=Bacteroides sp. TaxID=29523 RepID=UPI0023BE399A|nr:hypothetical protein [Bacteroides sp.]MDE6216737.1 hypothetical protein [Bacteroides sp.]
MNWKVTECYLGALIGIIVLACWETESDRMFLLHLVGIIVLIVFIFLIPWLAGRHIRTSEDAKKDAEARDFLKEYIRTEEMKKVYQTEKIKRLEEAREKLKNELKQVKNTLNGKAEDYEKHLSDFYDFLLVKLAEENKLLFSEKGFKELNDEFQSKQ